MNPWRNISPERRKDILCGLLLAAVILLMRALIHPVGEFPLNDDWSYARAVKSWVETGHLRFTGWTSVPLIAQVAWARLFCLPDGFSFAALRWSTTVLAMAAVWGLFVLLRGAGRSRSFAMAGALTLAVNPLFVNLIHTFMTDVPFLAACIWAMVGFVRALSDPKPRWLRLGFIASLMAVLIRHTGMVLPIAFWMSTWFRPRDAARKWAGWGLVVIALALAASCWLSETYLGMHPFWFRQGGRLMDGLTAGGLIRVLERSGEIFLFMGLFSLPLLPVWIASRKEIAWGRVLAWVLPVSAAGAWLLSLLGIRLPFGGNVMYNCGLGPIRLFDSTTLGLTNGLSVSPVFWTVLTAASLAGTLMAVTAWFHAFRKFTRSRNPTFPKFLFGLLASAAWLLPMVLGGYFDRYLLVLIPFWMLALGGGWGEAAVPNRLATLFLLMLFAAFGVAATHDSFSWNRARWQLLDEQVVQKGIPPQDVDGGFEFNGWHAYDPVWPADLSRTPGRSWWWVMDERLVVTMGPVDGYREIARVPFDRWLPGPDGAMRLLERTEEAP